MNIAKGISRRAAFLQMLSWVPGFSEGPSGDKLKALTAAMHSTVDDCGPWLFIEGAPVLLSRARIETVQSETAHIGTTSWVGHSAPLMVNGPRQYRLRIETQALELLSGMPFDTVCLRGGKRMSVYVECLVHGDGFLGAFRMNCSVTKTEVQFRGADSRLLFDLVTQRGDWLLI